MENILKATFTDKSNWIKGTAPRVLIMMSGGVDSSAAALILQSEGYDAAGLTMSTSADTTAAKSAAEVCRELNIPHFSVNITGEFKNLVSGPFCRLYQLGKTPNPCADCNERIKFGLLWNIAENMWGDDFAIATGHYARIVKRYGVSYLARGANLKKDQSYFMSGIKRERLARILFPLGDFITKDRTRDIVRQASIEVAERPESMEICFAGESDYRSIIEDPGKPGPILNKHGERIGTHQGISNYTAGQRKGLGIASKAPLFVTKILPAENTIIASEREEAFSKNVCGTNLNVLLPPNIDLSNIKLRGKIRSQGDPSPCKITAVTQTYIQVEFDEPLFAPAAGQRLVLYTDDDIVAAGAVITN